MWGIYIAGPGVSKRKDDRKAEMEILSAANSFGIQSQRKTIYINISFLGKKKPCASLSVAVIKGVKAIKYKAMMAFALSKLS